MSNLKEKVSIYRKIRKTVWEEATMPVNNSATERSVNQELFKTFLLDLCERCNLNNHIGTNEDAAMIMWHKMWTVIRYAGIKSSTATREIKDIEHMFDDYRMFLSPEWDVECHGDNLISAGQQVLDFKHRNGAYAGCQTVAKLPKIKRTVGLARALADFMDSKSPDTPVIEFLTSGLADDDVWSILDNLQKINYRAKITGTHLMMDMGFHIIKPDIVISSLFLSLGWTHEVIPTLPADLTYEDLKGKGKYGGKYTYTKPNMFKPVIELARRIVTEINCEELKEDIGWVSNNSIREFDFFMVKYGQKPEPNRGIVRTLFSIESVATPPKVPCSSLAPKNIASYQSQTETPTPEKATRTKSYQIYALTSDNPKRVFLSTHVKFAGKTVDFLRVDMKTWKRSETLQAQINKLSYAPDLYIGMNYSVANQDKFQSVIQKYKKLGYTILGKPRLKKKNKILD